MQRRSRLKPEANRRPLVRQRGLSFAFLGQAESWAKTAAGVAALLYAAGLVSYGLLLTYYHVRAVELVKFQHVLTGAWLAVFVSLQLLLPRFLLRSRLAIAAWLTALIAGVSLLNPGISNVLQWWLQLRFPGTSSYDFDTPLLTLVIGQFGFICMLAVAAWLLFSGALRFRDDAASWVAPATQTAAVIISALLFTSAVLPQLPQTLGGAAFPVVRVSFVRPTDARLELAFATSNDGIAPAWRTARLVTIQDGHALLLGAAWFDSTIIEVALDKVVLIEYFESDRREIGLTPQRP